MASKFKEILRRLTHRKHDEFIPLNETFSYGITGETAHIHLPKRLDSMIREKGLAYTTEHIGEELIDALDKLCEIAKNNPKIKTVFAVSPLLSSDMFRERLEALGFRTEQASKMFEKMFPEAKNLRQCSIPIERLRQVLDIEKKTKEDMDTHGEMWHDRILYYKYQKLKDIGIIDYYHIPLDKVVEMGRKNYEYRHGLPFTTKAERRQQLEARIMQSTTPEQKHESKEDPER